MKTAASIVAACFAFVLLGMHAQAQQPAPANDNQKAKELARRLGKEMSVEGLETIVASRNVDLFTEYERGWREVTAGRKPQPLPPAVEALLIKNYQDPVMGPALRTLCTSNWTPYQTRELFDLMFAEWRSGKVRPSTYPIRDAVLRTDLKGIEGPLLFWIESPDRPQMEDLRQVIGFLGRRKYEPAIPVITGYLRNADRGTANTAVAALIDIGTPAAIEVLLARMAEVRADTSPTAKEERENLANRIAQLPDTLPIPYARFRAALPENTRRYSVTWLSKRKDTTAVPDALEYMGDEGGYGPAIQALIATDSPEIWKQARARAEQLNAEGRLKGGEYAFAKSMLDEKIADPDKYFAQKRQQVASQQYYKERSDLDREVSELKKLRSTDPERYVKEMKAQLAKNEKHIRDKGGVLGTFRPQDELRAVGLQYLTLGHFVRFRMKKPRDALELYAASQRNDMIGGGFAIGDTWQHDLRDPKRAAAQYREFLIAVRRAPRSSQQEEQAVLKWADRWVTAQLAYLDKGTTFSGTLTGDDLVGATMATFLGIASVSDEAFDGLPMGRVFDSPESVDGTQVAKVLQGLPTSAFAQAYGTPLLGYLPDARSVLAFLRRHDPAGYASACFFAIVDLADREGKATGRAAEMLPGMGKGKAGVLLEARAQFMREHRITVDAKEIRTY